MIYQNYHRHSNYSIVVAGGDSVVKNDEYAIRASELGHGIISGVEHGFQGRHIEGFELAKKYGLKYVFGSEAYWVKNKEDKDRTNNHIILLAKNETGRKALNVALADAFVSGYYYVPRLDLNSIFSLPKNDIWVTSACIGGWKYDDADNVWLSMAEHFGDNFFFEVQYHNTESQKQLNHRILNLASRNNIQIIFGCDSHYIYSEQSKDRDQYLLSKGIVYEDEAGWYMDYPDGNVAFKRFIEQGVLSKREISDAMENTNALLDVEEYTSPVYNKEIKMPSLFPDKPQDEKNEIYENLVWEKWNEEKKNIPPELWSKYEKEIKYEISVVKNIAHADYFLLDYAIIQRAKEKGGVITATGRGSGVSFYTSKLLGMTKIDRISSPVKLYPERFLSETRIIETKSLADFDLNLANPKVFSDAQKEILGEECSFPMIAWGTMRTKEAWKMYARAENVDFDTANHVSSQLDDFEQAKKHADEDDDDISILDYVDKKYSEMVLESKKYLGIYSNVKIHPCGHLIAPFNIIEEAGLIAMKTAKGGVNVCTLIDGDWAEKYKMVKNDLLKVSVVDLYSRVFSRIGIDDIPDSKNIWERFSVDSGMQDVYSKGIVLGINQVEQPSTAKRVKKYSPKNISELSAFVAAIRPGFSSMYQIFENREPFKYDINDFDEVIQTDEMPNSFVLYQEQAMAALAFAGIPMTETYEIVKSIAKKRYEQVFKYKEIFVSGFSNKLISRGEDKEHSINAANSVWKILEDSSRYSFNASHSLSVATDSLYTAYLKANYPQYFYEQFMRVLEEGGEKDRLAEAKSEAEKFYGINFLPLRFGQDNREILTDGNSITMSISTIKGFGHETAEQMLFISKNCGCESFLDILVFAEENGILSKSKWEKLILIGYFSDFGNGKKCLSFFEEFTSGKNRYSKKLTQKSKEQRLGSLLVLWDSLPNNDFNVGEKIKNELAVFENISSNFPEIDKHAVFVLDVDERYSPRLKVRFLNNGKIMSNIKISKKKYKGINIGEVIYLSNAERKPAVRKVDDEYILIPDEYVWWCDYDKISNINSYVSR